MKNRKGWIRIVEAFTAILVFAGIILIVVGSQDIRKNDPTAATVMNAEVNLLHEIQLQDNLREEILSTQGTVEWDDMLAYTIQTRNYIVGSTPNSMICMAKICDPADFCLLQNQENNQSIYAESVTITSTLNQFNPRTLKLFCWPR